jgi:hypothetical protein
MASEDDQAPVPGSVPRPKDDDPSPLAEQVDESWVLLYHATRGWYWARVTDLIPPAPSER